MNTLTWHQIVYLFSLLIAIVVMGYIAWYARRNRHAVTGAGVYQWIALMVGLLALFQAVSMVGPSEQWARFWFNARFLFLASVPVVWLVFVLHYIGRPDLVTKPRVAALLVIPAVTQVMIWTNGWHHLWTVRDAAFVAAGPFLFPETTVRVTGPWFMVYSLYANAVSLAGLALLVAAAVRMEGIHRGQAILLCAGKLVMLLGILFLSFNIVPGMKLNPVPLGLAIGSLIIALAIFRYRFLAVMPAIDRRKPVPLALMALFTTLAVSIVMIGFYYYGEHSMQYRHSIEKQLSSIADLKVDELLRWRQERISDGATLSGNATLRDLVRRHLSDPGDRAVRWQIYSWLLTIRDSYGYDSIMLADAHGAVRITTNGGKPVFTEPHRYLEEARGAGRAILTDFHRDGEGLPIHLSVIAPLNDGPGHGASLGFVVMFVDPERYLYPMITRWPVPSRTAETLLVRREGDDVLFLNELRFRDNAALKMRFPLSTELLPAAAAARGITGVFEGIDYRGKPVMAALRAVPGSPWFMVARMDVEEVYAPLRERFWVMMSAVAVLIAGAAAGTALLWRRQDERHLYERLAAAEALRESEEKFRDIFESSTVGKSLIAPDGSILQVNRSFADMLGYAMEELREAGFPDIIYPEDLAKIRGYERSLLAGERTACRFEMRYLHKDGVVVWADVSIRLHHASDGTPSYFMTSAIDITERKRAEEDLSALSRRHEALLNAVPEIVMEVDTARVYTWSNQHGREFFGDDVVGRKAEHYFVGEQDTYERVQALFDGAESTVYLESLQRRRDGESRLLAWWCRVLRDASGNVTGALSSARDITEQKRAEEELRLLNESLEERVGERTAQLEAANRELEAFAYSVSHDLRAPLRSIDGFSQAVLEDYADRLDDQGRDYLGRLRAASQRMGGLIDDILRLSRISRAEMRISGLDLSGIAGAIMARLAHQEPERRVEAVIQEEANAVGDRELVTIVMENLLGNAWKFTSKKREARVEFGSIDREGERVFFVRDNGAGFDMRYADRLFTPFQRLHGKNEFEGSGIGLSLVQRIINRHGGRVWAESEPERGASVFFTLG